MRFENAHPEKLDTAPKLPPFVGPRFSHFVLVLGVGGLLFVPIFKAVTGLPPYLGMLISLGVLWVFTELVYDHKQNMEESIKNRVSKVLKHIDMPTILFFLGILMSVAALQSAGLLTDFADFLDKNVHEVYTIAGITGLLSAVIDNVPLVAACMGMYPVVDTAALASSLDPVYMQAFVQDGIFWHLLTFCAGVGGSLLIIGSAAGVVAMGLEKIEFGWYLRKITLLALAGYPNATFVEGKRPWEVKADIALPCATQNELNGEDAQNLIKNDVLCVGEISNMGCTPEAIDLFIEHKTMYAPGKAVNAGGVATSGLEMSQNAMHLSWSAAEVDEKLHAIMHGIHAQCVKYGTEPDGYINYVKGANIAGFMKVAHAMMGQGVI